jgi:hypothetical protein
MRLEITINGSIGTFEAAQRGCAPVFYVIDADIAPYLAGLHWQYKRGQLTRISCVSMQSISRVIAKYYGLLTPHHARSCTIQTLNGNAFDLRRENLKVTNAGRPRPALGPHAPYYGVQQRGSPEAPYYSMHATILGQQCHMGHFTTPEEAAWAVKVLFEFCNQPVPEALNGLVAPVCAAAIQQEVVCYGMRRLAA